MYRVLQEEGCFFSSDQESYCFLLGNTKYLLGTGMCAHNQLLWLTSVTTVHTDGPDDTMQQIFFLQIS